MVYCGDTLSVIGDVTVLDGVSCLLYVIFYTLREDCYHVIEMYMEGEYWR